MVARNSDASVRDGPKPPICLQQGCIYVGRQRFTLRGEGNICLLSYDTNPKPIPRVRSSPRCRRALNRVGMGSSVSINLPSQNDEPSAFIPRRLRATIGFPFPFSLFVCHVFFCFVFLFFVFAPPTTRTRLSQAKAGSLLQQLKRTNLSYQVCA